ncbi:MAG TPA: alpha/beta hydrolase [Minicystis sp.]|nr:alpha/beta hydrolase [Minicystis sp.]
MNVLRRKVRGAEARYGDAGPRDAPVLLALPGYPDNYRVFERLAAALPAWRLVAVDWPGSGRSAPVDGVLGPTARAAWLGSFLDELGVERCTLFGHDMGALPALCFARDVPHRAARVFVAHALLCNDEPTSAAIRIMRAGRLYRVAMPLAPGLIFERCMATFLEAPLGTELRRDMREDFVRAGAPATLASVCAAYDAELPGALASFASIRAPVHAIWGDAETHFPVGHARALAAARPGTTVRLVKGGHWMVHERAAAVAEEIAALASR